MANMVALHGSNLRVAPLILLVAAASFCTRAEAQVVETPPEPGAYQCLIASVQSQINVVTGGSTPVVYFYPSALGTLTLDAKGNYSLSSGARGRYSFDPKTGKVTFTGFLTLSSRYVMSRGKLEFIFTYASRKGGGKQDHFCAKSSPRAAPSRPGNVNGGFTGTITFTDSNNLNKNLGSIHDVDLATGRVTLKFGGGEPYRGMKGETVYTSRDNKLVIAGKDGLTISRLDTGYSQHDFRYFYPALSPDSRAIAYTTHNEGSYRDPSTRVVVYELGGRQLASFPGYAQPAWTPDGRLVMAGSAVVFDSRGENGLYVTDSGLKRVLRLGPALDTPQMPAVSPDGQRVVFIYGNALWVMNMGGGGLKRLTDEQSPVRWGAWSPDGKAVAYLLSDSSSYTIKILPLDGRRAIEVTNGEGEPIKSLGRITWRI